ncbi:MAG: hypothetical protein KC593_02320 [Myxococcales bacterium]|nr:hypothetical protein [Myxococcales bacterium]MCB9629493.1 hypothetical protein [Sandaracinaceae bacterium]
MVACSSRRSACALFGAAWLTLASLTTGCGSTAGALDQGAGSDLGGAQDAGPDQSLSGDASVTGDLGRVADLGRVDANVADLSTGPTDMGTVPADMGTVPTDMGRPDQGPPCGPATCSGCCDFLGVCRAGDTFAVCGGGGGACSRCTWPETCEAGSCEPRACSATAPSRGVNGSDTCGPAGREYICDCPDNAAGCSGTGVCTSQYQTRWRFRVATVQFDPTVVYDPGPPGNGDFTIAPDPIVELQFGNTPAYTTPLVEGAYYHEYMPIVGALRGPTGLPLLRVTLYDADYPGLSQRLHCDLALDEAEDVRARRLVCQQGTTYVELFVEPM